MCFKWFINIVYVCVVHGMSITKVVSFMVCEAFMVCFHGIHGPSRGVVVSVSLRSPSSRVSAG